MACVKMLFHLLTIVATFSYILAEEGSGDPNAQNDRDSPSGSFQFPTFGGPGNSWSFPSFNNPFTSGLSSNSSGMSGLGFPFNFGSFFGGSRQAEAVPDTEDKNDEESDDDEPTNRFFFSLLSSRLTTCNYTTQAGNTCVSCRQSLTCRRNNVGILRNCKKYCRNGRCSIFPGEACFTSSTTTAATTTAATTESTTSATDSTTVTG